MKISLHDLRFHAFHGAVPQERVTGGEYAVELSVTLSDRATRAAQEADELQATVDYSQLFALVKAEMTGEPVALLEHLAYRIARRILQTFPLVLRVEIAVTKLAPPIATMNGKGAGVELDVHRRLVVWDFDGTIADTAAGIVRTMQKTFEQMRWAMPTAEAVRQTIGLPLVKGIKQLADCTQQEAECAADVYRDFFEEIGTQDVCAFPQIEKIMQAQRAAGDVISIATSRGHESVENLLRQIGLRNYVSEIVACEDVAEAKPAPEAVFTLCRRTEISPADTVVIGDTIFDIQMARAARVGRAVGVSWGNHTPQQLRRAGADEVLA